MRNKTTYLLGYYRDELAGLLNYLEDKEPLSDHDIKKSREWLIEIKTQINEYAIETDDPVFERKLSNCLNSLPDPLTNPAEWHNNIYQSMRTLRQ